MRPLKILSVDDDPTLGMILKAFIASLGHVCRVVSDGEQAIELYQQEPFDLVLIDQLMPGMDGISATKEIRQLQQNTGWRPIIMLSGISETEDQVASLNAGCDDFIAKPVNFSILAAKINAFYRITTLQEQVAEQNKQLLDYAQIEAEERRISRYLMERLIRRNLLDQPRLRYLLQPTREVSGDMLLACPASNGDLYVLLADATGHGLPAALTQIPLSQTFYAMASKGYRIEHIAREINLHNRAYLPADRFVAALLAVFKPRENLLTVWNGGIPPALLHDEQGRIVRRFKSLNLPLGIVDDENFSNESESVVVQPGQHLLLYSDGLIEAENASGEQFGRQRLELCLAHNDEGDPIENLQRALQQHLNGLRPHDDLSCLLLACNADPRPDAQPSPSTNKVAETWQLQLTLSATQLQRLDLAPLVGAQCNTLGVDPEKQSALVLILNELLTNALDHGVLQLDSSIKSQPDGFERYFDTRNTRLAELHEGEIHIDIHQQGSSQGNCLRVHVSDSGHGFDFQQILAESEQTSDNCYYGRGLHLVRSLCKHLEFHPPGNSVTAELHWSS